MRPASSFLFIQLSNARVFTTLVSMITIPMYSLLVGAVFG